MPVDATVKGVLLRIEAPEILCRACRVAEVWSPGARFQPKEHDVLFLG